MNDWILNVEDLTEKVSKWSSEILEKRFDIRELPIEKEYEISDFLKQKLGTI